MSDSSSQASPQFYIFECTNALCHLRFPVNQLNERVSTTATMDCPLCKNSAQTVLAFCPDATARTQPTASTAQNQRPIEVLIDNVRSIFNVGSIFRTADGAGIQQIHLCGITPTPDHPKMAKTALGAEQAIAWRYHKNGLEAVTKLKDEGREIWGLEETVGSHDLYASGSQGNASLSPVLLIVGNEVSGIDPGILRLCDNIYQLPMDGTKRSLNVAVAFGIALYHLQFGTPRSG